MRHHFHRCGHLRVIDLDARDLSRARKGGKQILDELCEAKHFAPCVGLAECDVLSAGQKRELLVTRATRLREEEGGVSTLADADAYRAHPEHRRFVDEFVAPRCEVRKAWSFEVESR